ncbi:MAG TPA: hypothetical protein VL357_07985 [Rariglobus sp.]|jgi:hypothetical protein|nr:hypothetical protein [Rariglobus sp.]
MRPIASLLLSLTLGVTASFAAELKIVRVMPDYQPADAFKRISEYFNGKENTGGAIIVRTQPAHREGYYFLVRVKTPAPLEVAWIETQVITPTNPEPRTDSFAVSLPAGSEVIKLGFTGTDWPDSKAIPVAWKLRFLSSDGKELATEQSYLWSKPPGPAVAVK